MTSKPLHIFDRLSSRSSTAPVRLVSHQDMSTLKAFRKELGPLLKPLDPETRLIAIEICFAHKTLGIFKANQTVEQQQKKLRIAALGAIRDLKRLSKTLPPLKSQVESLCDPIRIAHTPTTLFDLLPPPVPSTPAVEYFQRQSARDPAQVYLDFSGAIALFQSSVDTGIADINKYVAGMRRAWKYPVQLFWKSGCLEYTLMRLFKERARPKINIGEAQELTAKILIRLDKGVHTADGVRIAAKRIQTLPENRHLREACDIFVTHRFKFPHSH